MDANLFSWTAVLGAFPRIAHYREVLSATSTYFERLRIVNEALGPHWIFRLADTVGLEAIKKNRPSWHEFYVEDVDRLHCPLDPGAPETEAYLGKKYSDMDMAFYAGMGFDGYRLALQTQRLVKLKEGSIAFAGKYILTPSSDFKEMLDEYDRKRFVPKEDYYAHYGAALSVLYEKIDTKSLSDGDLLQLAAGCLILLCGGHKGCNKHSTPEDEFQAQIESLIIFNHARNLIVGKTQLDDSISPGLHAVS